ncbi:MAG: hypothetical protein GY940_14145, partial [bacterium]|nr:hypothetical protein [bacterium]
LKNNGFYMSLREFQKQALSIRAFEYKLFDLFAENLIHGTVHTYIGQEMIAGTLCPHLDTEIDAIFAGHRGHGYYLAYGGPEEKLLAELMGKPGALCNGRGGTQHLHYKRFFSNGIQGGIASLAVGYAWAMKLSGENAITVVQLGDGTLGEGALYEAFTFASLLKVPVLFVIERNGCAQSTDTATTTPGDLKRRMEGFGLACDERNDKDPDMLFDHFAKIVERTRKGEPFVQIVKTRRLLAHSKGDDHRSPDHLAELRREDPLNRLLEESQEAKTYYELQRERISEIVKEVAKRQDTKQKFYGGPGGSFSKEPPGRRRQKVSVLLNEGLDWMMERDEKVILVGEDLADPYGGAFKVSRGLSTRYPGRVFSSPISESAIVGVSNGLALAGYRPVAEIMFGDFVTLAGDQLINHAAKFFYMYGGKVTCPVTVRMVSGGYRGYGPTHSQSLERVFCGIPGLKVVALSRRHDPGRLLQEAVYDDSPVIFVENKLLYSQVPVEEAPFDMELVRGSGDDAGGFPSLYFRNKAQSDADVTVVTYGGMTGIVEAAMKRLIVEEEYFFDYIVLTRLWPLQLDDIIDSVKGSGKLVVVE